MIINNQMIMIFPDVFFLGGNQIVNNVVKYCFYNRTNGDNRIIKIISTP